MKKRPDDEVLAILSASIGRRFLGVGSLGCLGLFLLYFAFAQPADTALAQGFLLIAGVGAVWLADKMRRATSQSIELTSCELRTSHGEQIARLDEIDAVDRSIFAFKPSNGFLIRLKSSREIRWRPGLWWRFGRRVGIGGVTPGSHAKAMSEIIAVMLLEQKK